MRVDKGQDYTCEMCKGTFEAVVTHDEAVSEAEQLFGTHAMEHLAIVCDDCWKILMTGQN